MEGDIKTWSQLRILNPNKVTIAVGEASNPVRLICNSMEEEICKYVQNVEDSLEIYTVTTKKNKSWSRGLWCFTRILKFTTKQTNMKHVGKIRSDQSFSRVWLFATPWIAAHQASLSITNSWRSLRLTSIESELPSSHLILCRPLLLLPPIPPSIRVFSNESTLRRRWPKYWSFSFSIIPSKEIPGLISFRIDWLDLLAVQGTLKSLLQTHSSKTSSAN